MTRKKMMTLGITVLTLQSSLLPAGMVYAETKEAQNEHQEYGANHFEQNNEQFLANQQTNILEYTETRNTSAVPIKDYEGTAFMNNGNLSEKALDMIGSSGAIPVKVTEKTQLFHNGVVKPDNTNLFAIHEALGHFERDNEIIYTHIGMYRGEPVEAKINLIDAESPNGSGIISFMLEGNQASISTFRMTMYNLEYEFRLMDTKEVISNNIIFGSSPITNLGMEHLHKGLKYEFSTNNLRGLIIDEVYRGVGQISKLDNVISVSHGSSEELLQFQGADMKEVTVFNVLETGSFNKKVSMGEMEQVATNSRMSILDWPGDESIIRGSILETTISNLNTDSIKVTGTAEPNGNMIIKAGESIIAEGQVESDGTYSLDIENQSAGTKVTAQASIDGVYSNVAETVVIRERINETTIYDMNTDSTKVTGTAEPNANITIKAGNNVIAEGTVGSNGAYSLSVEKQSAGTKVTAQATIDGISSNIAETTVIRARIDETTISELNTDSTRVEGKAEPNANIVIKAGEETIASGRVGSDGRYALSIPKQQAGTVITAQATLNDISSNIAETTVVRAGIDETTISELDTDSTQVKGTAEPNSTIVIKAGETTIASGRVGSDGIYSLTIPKQQVGTVITAQATLNGISSNVAETIVVRTGIDETTISDLNTDSTSVTGSAEANATIVIKAGDVIIANGRVGSDGIYSLTIPKQQAGTIVTAQATLNGVESNIAETTVVRATIDETTLNEVKNTSTSVSGTAEPGAQVRVIIGHSDTKQTTVDNNGRFEVRIDPQATGTVITAQASMDSLESNIASTVVITDPESTEGTITPGQYNISSGDQFIRGTYTGDVDSARVYVNGTSVRGGTFEDGKFEFFIGSRIQSVDDVVEIEALDPFIKVIDRKTVDLTRDLAGAITPNEFRVGDTMITGTFTGDVNFARLILNGNLTSSWGGTFTPDGNFSFYAANLGIKTGDQVEIQAMNRQVNGNSEVIEILETKEVPVTDNVQSTIATNKYSYLHSSITGTFTGNINFANLVIDGQSVANWGGTFNDATGNFDFFVHAQFREQIRNASKVQLQTFHRETINGQTIDHKLILQPVEMVDVQSEIQPAVFKMTDNEITGTYTGDINFANLIIDGTSISWGGLFDPTTQTFSYFVNEATRNLMREANKVEIVAYHRGVVSGNPIDTPLNRNVIEIEND